MAEKLRRANDHGAKIWVIASDSSVALLQIQPEDTLYGDLEKQVKKFTQN